MSSSTRLVGLIGMLMLLMGLGLSVASYWLGKNESLAFFMATGIALIVASWLRHSTIVGHSDLEDQSDTFVSRNQGYLVLGLFIFIGLALVGVPIALLLLSLAAEESELISERTQHLLDALLSVEGGGPSYYAFLLGVLYFLSSKRGPASD